MTDSEFLADAAAFIEPLIPQGRVLSLAQMLIHLTAPGVPDIYQGDEIWNLGLVDPDNRRPVDFQCRRRLLAQLESMDVSRIMERADEGFPKLWLITKALPLRSRLGGYAPLSVAGPHRERAIAFARGEVVVVAPRLPVPVAGWCDTSVMLPADNARKNVLTGERVAGSQALLSTLFEKFPVALLVPESFAKHRRTSATLHACAIQPRGVCGSSASKISLIDPTQASIQMRRKALQQIHACIARDRLSPARRYKVRSARPTRIPDDTPRRGTADRRRSVF